MAVATRSTELSHPLSGLEHSEAPVLFFEVDASAVTSSSRSSRRGAVRSLGSLPMTESGVRRPLPAGEDTTVVLVLRSLSASRLLACVRALSAGGEAMPAELLRQTRPGAGHAVRRQLEGRELDVLRLLADGHTTAGIAQQLSYSERTVKNVVHDLLEKLNCRTRAQAVALAARQGVI